MLSCQEMSQYKAKAIQKPADRQAQRYQGMGCGLDPMMTVGRKGADVVAMMVFIS